MAHERPTMLDIAKAKNADAVITEVIQSFPELMVGQAETIAGTTYETEVFTAFPSGQFRNANEGVEATRPTSEKRIVQCRIFDSRWECDKMVANRHPRGTERYIFEQGQMVLRGAMLNACKQLYYGVTNDAKGFPGLVAGAHSDMVLDATGTTDAAKESVWFVRWGAADLAWLYGQNGLFDLSAVREESITDANSKKFDGYVQTLTAWIGATLNHKWCVGRIKNVSTDSGKGLTDSLLAQMLEKFPTGFEPNAIFMSRRSRRQLQTSRTATTPTGSPAPRPTEYEGIPIYTSEAITTGHAAELL